MGTTGNIENRNSGLDFNFKKPLGLWAIEGGLAYIRVEKNEPLEGFKKTDTITALSLVLNF